MIERLAARFGRFDEDGEILAGLLLAGEFGEPFGAQRGFQFVLLGALGREDAGCLLDGIGF